MPDVWLTPDARKLTTVMDKHAAQMKICRVLGQAIVDLDEPDLLGITFVMTFRIDSQSSSAVSGAVGQLEISNAYLYEVSKRFLNSLPDGYPHEITDVTLLKGGKVVN